MEASASTTGIAGSPALLRPVLRGLAWTGGAQAVDQGLRLVVAAVIARALGPGEFGLAGMAIAVAALGTVLADAAMGSAIVQRPILTEADRSTAFWTGLGAATALAAVGCAAAAPAAAFYGEPRVAGLLAAMMGGLVLSGAAATHSALLARAMRFRSIALVGLAGQLAGAALGVTIALEGGGAWAIVAQGLGSAGVACALYWLVEPWRPRLLFDRASFRELGAFSGRLLGSRVCFYLQRYADNLIVGSRLGVGALGAYALAYNLMMLPFQRLVDPLRTALFPALARMQDDLSRMRRAWLRCTRAVAALLIPLLVGLAFTADDLVAVVLGDGWDAAVAPIRVLAAVGALQSVIALNSLVLMALGRARALLRFSLVALALSLAGFLVGVRWGVTGVATGYLAATALIVPLYVGVALRALELRARALGAHLSGVAEAALGMAVILVALRLGLDALGAAPAVRLGACVALGAAAAGALLAWRVPELVTDARAAYTAVVDRPPDPVRSAS